MNLICGKGKNDADYFAHRYETIEGKRKLVWVCPFYRAWKSMIERAYSESFHKQQPTYLGVTVCEEWLTFSVFKRWMEQQNWRGMELDKDILFPGNKMYSPDKCVFVDRKTNGFFTDSAAVRGELPIGVHWHKNSRKFIAKCRNPFSDEQEHLGQFDDPQLAHKAWLKRKYELACLLAENQSDKRVAQALIERYAQMEHTK